ncbi:MAG: HAD family phosphatase [Oscillibacter sp.]|nr:HAD family phosphatase [Oscillibacter sp.]
MRLQSAIFDMDGTLLDSMPAWRSLLPDILRDAGIVPTPEQAARIRTLVDRDMVRYLQTVCGLDRSEEEIRAEMEARMEDFYLHRAKPKPGLVRFLTILKMEGVWMYVATATKRSLSVPALHAAGLDGFFRGLLTSEDAHSHKSESAEIFEMAMRRLRSNKLNTVVFEDALYAIRTAKAAGFRVAGVYDAAAEADQDEIRRISDYYVRSFEEMVSVDAIETGAK